MKKGTAHFLLYLSCLMMIAVLAAEFIIIPYTLKLPRDTLLMGFAATPGTKIDGQIINAMGFTGDVLAKEKSADTFRVLLLGSSVMFNRQMGERLKQALQQQASGKKVELLNTGLRSHTTRSDLLKMQLFADYNFDLIIFYDGINDLWANHVPAENYHDDYRQLGVWYQRSVLLDHSLVWRYTYNALQMLVQYGDSRGWFNAPQTYQVVFPGKRYLNAASFASVNSYTGNVNAIINLAQQHQSKILLMTFAYNIPTDYSRQKFINGKLGYINPDNYDKRDINNWGTPKYVSTGLTLLNSSLQKIALERNIPLLDIQHEIGGQIQFFGDVCHFNDAGVDTFIKIVASHLQEKSMLE